MSWSKRILLDSILLLSILFLPWYVPTIFGMVYFWKKEPVEILCFAYIMDLLYSSNALGHWYLCTSIAGGTMIAFHIIKQKIRLYQ